MTETGGTPPTPPTPTPSTSSTSSTGPRKRRLSLRRRGLKLLLDLLGRQESPERVAAALSLGVGIGLSPFIGFHLIMAIALASLFRLSRIDTVLGSLVGNPWTLPPFFALGYRVGRAILGYGTGRVPPLHWQRILHEDFWVTFRGPGFGPRLASFLVGTTLLAAVIALVVNWVLLIALRIWHQRHPRVAARAARRREKAAAKRRFFRSPEPRPHDDDRVH